MVSNLKAQSERILDKKGDNFFGDFHREEGIESEDVTTMLQRSEYKASARLYFNENVLKFSYMQRKYIGHSSPISSEIFTEENSIIKWDSKLQKWIIPLYSIKHRSGQKEIFTHYEIKACSYNGYINGGDFIKVPDTRIAFAYVCTISSGNDLLIFHTSPTESHGGIMTGKVLRLFMTSQTNIELELGTYQSSKFVAEPPK